MKKSFIFFVIGLLFATICVANFNGTYKGEYKNNRVEMKLVEAGDGSITGSVNYSGANYKLSAKKESDSITEAKGSVTNTNTQRKIYLERRGDGVKVTLYPENIRGEIVSTTLNRELSQHQTMNITKINIKKQDDSDRSIVGRWVGEMGELDLRSDGFFTYHKKNLSNGMNLKKRDFRKTLQEPTKEDEDAGFNVNVKIGNSNVEVGNKTFGDEMNMDMQGKDRDFGSKNSSWRDKRPAKIEPIKRNVFAMANSGRWEVKNSSLYMKTKSSLGIVFYGQLSGTGKEMIISKNSGKPEIWHRVK